MGGKKEERKNREDINKIGEGPRKEKHS